MKWHSPVLAASLLLGLLPVTLAAQPPDPKPTVPSSDFGRFERLGSPTLAPDGASLAWVVERVDGERHLTVRRLEPDHTWRVPWGRNPVFSHTGAYLAWTVTPSKSEQERLEKEEKPIRQRGELLAIATGERRDLGEVADLAFDPTGQFLAVRGVAESEGESQGKQGNEDEPSVSDLHIHELAAGTATVLGNVEHFAWHDELPLLALITASAGDRGNSVQIYAPADGRLRGLDHSTSRYRHLAWHEESADLAVLREKLDPSEPAADEDPTDPSQPSDTEPGSPTEENDDDTDTGDDPSREEPNQEDESRDDEWADDTAFDLVAWRDLTSSTRTAPRVLVAETPGLRENVYVTGDATPTWSPDRRRLSFGVRVKPPEDSTAESTDSQSDEATRTTDDESGDRGSGDRTDDAAEADDPKDDDDELAGVQIWHSNDVDLVPLQKFREQTDRERSLLAVWDLEDDSVVQVVT